jgi:SOS-response transcriptional repressor LexA/DNA-binding XRE family transcriptional regulator
VPLGRKELGNRIKLARDERERRTGNKFSQKDLALSVNKSRSYIGDLESGRTYPSYALLSRISEACDVPLNFFDTEQSGLWVKQNRERQNMSIEDISLEATIPVDVLQQIEAGHVINGVTLVQWMKIGEVLGLTNEETMKYIFEDTIYQSFFKNDGNNKNLNNIKNILLNDFNNDSHILHKKVGAIPFDPESIIMLPVYGKIAAGIPITANQENDFYPLDTRFISLNGYSQDDFFFLRVQGDSMEPGIFNKDLVLVRSQPAVETNEVAVILYNGEDATIKRVTVAGDKIVLNSDNKNYPPQIYNAVDCRILGKVLQRIGKVV